MIVPVVALGPTCQFGGVVDGDLNPVATSCESERLSSCNSITVMLWQFCYLFFVDGAGAIAVNSGAWSGGSSSKVTVSIPMIFLNHA